LLPRPRRAIDKAKWKSAFVAGERHGLTVKAGRMQARERWHDLKSGHEQAGKAVVIGAALMVGQCVLF
jgi:hypothetical protein